MCTMNPNGPPAILLCPRCFCPLDMRHSYPINFPPPVPLPLPTPPPAIQLNQNPFNQPPADDNRPPSSPPPSYQQNNTPTPPPEPSTCTQPPGCEEGRDESRRSSASSSSSFGSAFSDFSINTEFAAGLQAVEDNYFSQPHSQGSSPPLPASSPSTESSVTLSASPPSTESSLVPSTPGELPSNMRRWVVFRGRAPGVYASP